MGCAQSWKPGPGPGGSERVVGAHGQQDVFADQVTAVKVAVTGGWDGVVIDTDDDVNGVRT